MNLIRTCSLFVLLMASHFIMAAVPQIEREALVALYNNTQGDNWFENSNWMEGDPCENAWFGVYCSNENVTGIELIENNLSGQIPPKVSQLSSLNYLDLSNNSLTGQIPAEIFGLNDLELLYLNSNNLTGMIPTEIGNLTNLAELSLSFNNLSGNIPSQIGNLINLYYLSLTHANLSGEIPTEIGNLTGLEGLYLFGNHLTGEIPASIGNLIQLRSLNLFNNQLSGEIPTEIGNLTLLRLLSINGNALSGEIPESMTNLQNLVLIYYEFNALYTSNSEVNEFLFTRSCFDTGFIFECPSEESQTLAPSNFLVVNSSNNSISLTWDQVNYSEPGGYQLWMSDSPTGPFSLIHETSSKTETMYEVTSLSAGTDYYFQLKSFTSAHDENRNLVYSDAVNLTGEKSSSIYFPMLPAHSGSWSNPIQDGHGLAIEVLPNNTVIIYWYVFDNAGNPIWLLGAGEYKGGQVTVDMSISSGGLFPPEFDANAVNRQFWGTMTLEFTANGSLQSSWVPKHDSDFRVGQLNMNQFARMVNEPNGSQAQDSHLVQSSHSGSWFDPAQNGHGLAVQILSNNVGVIYWYAFDNQGNQVWIVGSGSYADSQLTVELNTVSGAMFPPAFNSSDVIRDYWGTATLEFDGCNNGQFSWQPTENNPAYTAGQMPVQRITALSGLTCLDE